MTTATPFIYSRDHHIRRLHFVEESFTHKAKTNLYWLAHLIDMYTDLGQTVIDPMGGSGSILFASLKRRPTITGDIESHWCHIQNQNRSRILNETLIHAPAVVAQWDAAKLPIASSSLPTIITSPPYFDLFSNWNKKAGHSLDGRYVGKTGQCYGFHPRQLANIHIYENYLLAMRDVYREYWRILRHEALLILIIGNKVRRGRVVPITKDTFALLQSNGFLLVATHHRKTIPSQFRQIHHKRQGHNYPMITVETALVFQKQDLPPSTKRKFALVQSPKPNSSPGVVLFKKQLRLAGARSNTVLVWSNHKIYDVDSTQNLFWSSARRPKAIDRRELSHSIARDIVINHGLGAGDHIELHVTLDYARYLEQRLNTFGARATIPTKHLNFGQKLRWYTELLKG
ncbi:MAG TPA: hypothetical protein ENH62_06095 [Marinobacter sp.]|nr:hypothetical protein [Marinobacter sp.]